MNLKTARKAAATAARAAGRVMYANWHKPKHVNVDDPHDIKLELDVRCQKLIERSLRQAFPTVPLLGEEGIFGDGTVNYAFGLPHAAVSIALQYREQSVVGVIYDPFTDELWTVIRGGPTRLNGRPVRVSNRTRVEDSIIALGFSKSAANLVICLPHLNRLMRQAKKIRILGSAALELAYVASGRLDAYVERRINLWDVAAGSLMVESSGGEYYALPVAGKYRYTMCADNGKLRKKLRVKTLLQ
jgi:myo-inositol-1(or 4)-monophosphatase